jgi:hypothetical protein
MSVQFQDRYASRGFWFKDHETSRRFCLSASGDEGHDCLPNFSGSIAIAEYHFYPRVQGPEFVKIREHVRTIDQDSHVSPRPPFDGTLMLREHMASDIQAFGSTTDARTQTSPKEKMPEPWCFLRQDLFLGDQMSPFLIVHWKHTLNAITLIDVIAGERTQLTKG